MQKAKSYTAMGAAAADAAGVTFGPAANNEPFKRLKTISTNVGATLRDNAAVETLHSPCEFDSFIPWVCQQLCASTAVLVTSKIKEEYAKQVVKKNIKSKSRLLQQEETMPSSSTSTDETLTVAEIVIPITAYYDTKQRLVEILIVGCKDKIPRKVIKAISLSIPYHSSLVRFTFCRSSLTDELIYDINKLLPISNITEICLDDSFVQHGNYYILLENKSQLKYLSLNRCSINDDVCIKIFSNLIYGTFASNTLQILELGSNNITDVGTNFIASVLRGNRCLLHINLSGNKITDTGFLRILDCFKEFLLDEKEIMAMKRRRLSYLQNKMEVYQRCLNEVMSGKSEDINNDSGKRKKRLSSKTEKEITHVVLQDVAEVMAESIVGEFEDPFWAMNVVSKGELIYSKGNFVLCYINIAYNDLKFPSVKKLYEVLKYQEKFNKSLNSGLIRIVMDGNYIPEHCQELDEINAYLKRIIALKTTNRKSVSSTLIKRSSKS